jgi:hypothetical protein
VKRYVTNRVTSQTVLHLFFSGVPLTPFLIFGGFVSVLHYATAIAIKAVLWHMQEDLAPYRWWKLGKSLEESLPPLLLSALLL